MSDKFILIPLIPASRLFLREKVNAPERLKTAPVVLGGFRDHPPNNHLTMFDEGRL
jgi:hypothetical protein